MNKSYNPLFEPLLFNKGVKLKNRLIMAPMTNWSSNPDGTVSDEELEYYDHRTKGVSMVITACANVTPNGKGFSGEVAVDRDEMITSLSKLAKVIKDNGAKAVLQIYHGGRLCPPELVPNGDIVSASAVPAEFTSRGADLELAKTPRALENFEIEDIIRAFGEATHRAIRAGFDGVEIHGANRYLIHQFFSPHSNRRTDKWGGTLEKRMSFPLAVLDEVLKTVDLYAKRPFLVGYRFSPEERETPGFTMKDTLMLVDSLLDRQLDYLHVSLLNFWSKPRRGVNQSLSRIEWILKRVNNRVPVIGVGLIRTPDEALKAYKTSVSAVAMGRELIIEPDWVEKLANGRESEIQTTLTINDRERLVITKPLWKMMLSRPGWFPFVDKDE